MAKTAFITGVNGISGSALLEYFVKNTTALEWSSIIVTSKSPLQMTISDPRVEFISLDFTQSPSTLIPQMQNTCRFITHAYFCSYIHRDDFNELNAANEALFDNFVDALQQLCPQLENITLQTGGKYYQVHLHPTPWPLREQEPRQAASGDNFYFPQEDKLALSQEGKSWRWNVVRPVGIIGSPPKANGMNQALTIAIYFLICRELGHEARIPTNQIYWNCPEDFSYAPLLADLTFYVSTHKHCANEAFNMTNGDVLSYRYLWPRLASYFSATASSNQHFNKSPPRQGDLQQEFSLLDWSQDKRQVWDTICERAGLQEAKKAFDYATWSLVDWILQRTWSSPLSMTKARKFGWNGYIDSYECFVAVFDDCKRNGLIPK